MAFITLETTKPIDINDLKELLILMENQESTDKFTSTSMHIDGNFAEIDVEIDEDGNVTLL